MAHFDPTQKNRGSLESLIVPRTDPPTADSRIIVADAIVIETGAIRSERTGPSSGRTGSPTTDSRKSGEKKGGGFFNRLREGIGGIAEEVGQVGDVLPFGVGGSAGTALRVVEAAAEVIGGETGILEALGKTAMYGIGGRIINIDEIKDLTRSAELDRKINSEKPNEEEKEIIEAREELSETINNAQDVPPEEYEAEIREAETKAKAKKPSISTKPVGTAVSGGDKIAFRNGKQVNNVNLVEMDHKDAQGRVIVLDKNAAQMFSAMAADAKADGVTLQVNSSFRTNEKQSELYANYIENGGFPAAKPGYSKHQSGMALDIQHTGTALAWLQKNAKNYGFTQPLPKTDPVHWEYNGGEVAVA